MNTLNDLVTEITYDKTNEGLQEILHTKKYGKLLSTKLFNTPKTFIALSEENNAHQFIVMMDSKTKKFFAKPTYATATELGLVTFE